MSSSIFEKAMPRAHEGMEIAAVAALRLRSGLPRSAAGKVQRGQLRARYWKGKTQI
ncbi:MAG: hypothetical protein IPH83_18300 [Gammaproteobacteria bacterium]|nr:hypothetical protein [Gammaproteobacteria bacterium]